MGNQASSTSPPSTPSTPGRATPAAASAAAGHEVDTASGRLHRSGPTNGDDDTIYTWHQLKARTSFRAGFLALSLCERVIPLGTFAGMTRRSPEFEQHLQELKEVIDKDLAQAKEAAAALAREEYTKTQVTLGKPVDEGKMKKSMASRSARYEMDFVQAKECLKKALGQIGHSQLDARKLRVILIGRTNVGKTTFMNGATGSCNRTSVGGRVPIEELEGFQGSWTTSDGVRYEIEFIDTPGVDDDNQIDEETYQKLENLFTQSADIDGVLMVANGQAPVFDNAIVQQLRKYHSIFGDALLSNWSVLFSKWYMSPEMVDTRESNGTSEESISANATDVLQKELGFAPQKFFFADSLPSQDNELYTCDAYDQIVAWLISMSPINTNNFRTKSSSEKAHIRSMKELQRWSKYTMELSELVLETGRCVQLTNVSTAWFRSVRRYRLHGWQYDVRRFRFQLDLPAKITQTDQHNMEVDWKRCIDSFAPRREARLVQRPPAHSGPLKIKLIDAIDKLVAFNNFFIHFIRKDNWYESDCEQVRFWEVHFMQSITDGNDSISSPTDDPLLQE